MDARRLWGIWCVGGVCCCLMSGCLTHDAVYNDIMDARDEAYDAWRRVRESGDIPIPSENLTLEDAVSIALLYNKTIQASIQEREIARGQLLSAHQLALPRVETTASTETGSTDVDAAAISLRQPLFRGGGATAALRAARLYTYWSDESVRLTAQQVIYLVRAEYYSAVLAERLCQVNRDAVISAEAHLEDVRVKRANGVASKYDELRANVDVANFRAELIRQENNLVLAKTSLLRALGTATDATIALADELLHIAVPTTLEDAIATAYRHRPDLVMAELNIRMQQQQIRSIRASNLPEIDLVLGASTRRDRDGDDDWRGTQRAGIEFSWLLFDGFNRAGELVSAKARLRQREIELKDIEEDVFLDVQQALLNLRNAEEYVESQRLNLQHAEEGLRLAMTGYREGVNTEVEVVDARSALTEARGNYYRALYDHCMSRLSLGQAMGILGTQQEIK